jgi:hypothetical protein
LQDQEKIWSEGTEGVSDLSANPREICVSVAGAMAFVFCRLFPFSLQLPRQCLGPTCHLSILLTNAVSPVRACISIWWERFRGTQKKDELEPLCIHPLCASRSRVDWGGIFSPFKRRCTLFNLRSFDLGWDLASAASFSSMYHNTDPGLLLVRRKLPLTHFSIGFH